MKQLADRIRKARRLAGQTQSQAAQLLAVNRGTFGHWERGAGHWPTNANLSQLAVVLGVAYEWLATGRGSMQGSSLDDEVAAVRLDCFAQSIDEEQLLLAFRNVPVQKRSAVLDFAHSLVRPLSQAATLAKAAAASAHLHSTRSSLQKSAPGAGK